MSKRARVGTIPAGTDFEEAAPFKTYDVIFDPVGKLFFGYCKGSLEPGGCYLATDGFRNIPLGLCTRWFGDRKVRFALPPRYPRSDVALIKELVESGKFRPVIDRCYPLEDVEDPRSGPSFPHPVVEVNDAVSEATLGQEIELDLNAIGKGTLTASDHDRRQEQMELVYEPCSHRLTGELSTAYRYVAGRGFLEQLDR